MAVHNLHLAHTGNYTIVGARRSASWSNAAVRTYSGMTDDLTEIVLHELLSDRDAVCALLDALPTCESCHCAWVTQLAVLEVDIENDPPKIFGLCDDCPLPKGLLQLRLLPHASVLRELAIRRRVWDEKRRGEVLRAGRVEVDTEVEEAEEAEGDGLRRSRFRVDADSESNGEGSSGPCSVPR